MFTRISSLAPVILLAGCGGPVGEAPTGDAIECALDGAAAFAENCIAERHGSRVVVHRPDGGFRRFEAAADEGIAPLDGADTLTVTTLADGRAELAIGRDRYRIRLSEPVDAAKR